MTFARRSLPVAGLVLGLATLLALAALPMDSAAQMVAAVVLLGGLWIAVSPTDDEHHHTARLIFIVIGVLISLRYLFWRGSYTLYAADWISLISVYTLFIAELYSFAIHALGTFVNVRPLDRPDLSMRAEPADVPRPSVDVMVPSYNEEPELLEITLRAARQMRYEGKVTVCLLDDGGTDQKVNDPDPAKAAAALERRHELMALAERLGCRYITRARNEHAKAGNLNHALTVTDSDLVVILDADHVPTLDFLDRTVPWLARHPDVFLVQTPHFMINPDPIDRNLLQSFSRMPAENDMFYMTIQRGLDFWSASFFCGSAAVIRRKHLEEVGGLAGESITEDAEAALEMHSRGYRSVYLDEPMVAGLAPESFTGFVVQRMRWAQGMTQILLLKRPFMRPGLTWYQRVGYMSSVLFWLFPFARIIFLTAPLAYLIFGLEVYNASVMEILAYTVPHVIATYMVSTALFGRTRWPLISEVYEIMQCLFSLLAVLKVFARPRAPSFVVTPKGETLDDTFISPLSRPFYVLFWLAMLGFAGGVWRMTEYPLSRELTLVVLLWNIFNFITILAALGALLERRQRRAAPRMPVREQGELLLPDSGRMPVDITDLSAGGVRVRLPGDWTAPAVGATATLSAPAPALGRRVELPLVVRSVSGRAVGAAFDLSTERAADDAVAYVFGDRARWQYFQDRRLRKMPVSASLKLFFTLMGAPVRQHVRLGFAGALRATRARLAIVFATKDVAS